MRRRCRRRGEDESCDGMGSERPRTGQQEGTLHDYHFGAGVFPFGPWDFSFLFGKRMLCMYVFSLALSLTALSLKMTVDYEDK